MSEGFEIKKISQETLGEYLSMVREKLGLSVAEVSQQTGILEKFVVAMEEGKYHLLPPDAYVLGFLRKISAAYSISCQDLLEQYKKEKGIVEQTARERMVTNKGWRSYIEQLSVTRLLQRVADVGEGLGIVREPGPCGFRCHAVLLVNAPRRARLDKWKREDGQST